MDTAVKDQVKKGSATSFIFMQNKVFLDDIINVAEVRILYIKVSYAVKSVLKIITIQI